MGAGTGRRDFASGCRPSYDRLTVGTGCGRAPAVSPDPVEPIP
jgi:hypothetical protein